MHIYSSLVLHHRNRFQKSVKLIQRNRYPLRGRSREKTPLHAKKYIFFSLVLLLSRQHSLVFASCSTPVTSFDFRFSASIPMLIRTSHPSGSRLVCFSHIKHGPWSNSRTPENQRFHVVSN